MKMAFGSQESPDSDILRRIVSESLLKDGLCLLGTASSAGRFSRHLRLPALSFFSFISSGCHLLFPENGLLVAHAS